MSTGRSASSIRAPRRIAVFVTIALHACALAGLASYEPARTALFAAMPIMVDWIVPPRPEPARSEPQVEPPKPRPIARRAARVPESLPLLAAPAEPPSVAPVVAPAVAPVAPVVAPPPATVAPAAPSEPPAALTQPVFNADYLDNPAPAYPVLSRRMGEQGRVTLRVLVSAAGTADEVRIHGSSGFERLDEAARDTVRRWKFVPAKRGAEPVSAWVLIPISFRLEG